MKMTINSHSLLLLLVAIAALSTGAAQAPLTLTIATGDPALFEQAAMRYMDEHPALVVEILPVEGGPTDQLARYRAGLRVQDDRVDIYDIALSWPPLLETYLVDLNDQAETGAHFPAIIDAFTLDGALLALPYHIDAGMLYYQPDMLAAFGYQEPPESWDALTEMASTIQAGLRAEAEDVPFWGYLWQGERYESLTCAGLEWGMRLFDGADEAGRPAVEDAANLRALRRAVGWLGVISPPAVTGYIEADTRRAWAGGAVVFMRNWGYASRLETGFPAAVAPLPMGGCLRGRGLAVSRFSPHIDEAAALAAYLTGEQAQKDRSLAHPNVNPSRESLYTDADLLAAYPLLPQLVPAFESPVERPVAAAGPDYDLVSAAYFTALHRALTGEATPEEALADLAETLADIMPAGE